MGVSLVFLALFLSISVLMFFHPLISFANQNSNNNNSLLINMAVHAFLVCIVPFQFFSAVILLFLRVAAPRSAFFITHLARAARVLLSTTLLLAVILLIHTLFTGAITPDTLRVMFMGAAAAVIYRYNLYERYFLLAGRTAGSFVPAITALCISIGSFLFIDSFSVPLSDANHDESTVVPVPILLLVLSLDCLTFTSAMVLLFLRIGMPASGPQNHPITLGMIKNLVEATSAMSFSTTVLIAIYMLVP